MQIICTRHISFYRVNLYDITITIPGPIREEQVHPPSLSGHVRENDKKREAGTKVDSKGCYSELVSVVT